MENIFEMYQAKAIWLGDEPIPNQYVDFQKSFKIDFQPCNAKLYISVDTEYEVYINGNFIKVNQYDDYPNKKFYNVIEVSEYLTVGENLVSILAYSQGKSSFNYIKCTPMLIFLILADGKCICKSDESVKCRQSLCYRSGQMEDITHQLAYNFHINWNMYDGWKSKDISVMWGNAVAYDISNVEFFERPIKLLEYYKARYGVVKTQGVIYNSPEEYTSVAHQMQNAFLSARDACEIFEIKDDEIVVNKDNSYLIFDLGREYTGYFTLDITADENTMLYIGYGEHLSDLRVRTYVGNRNFAFSYACAGGGQNFTYYIKRIAGRYLQVHISNLKTSFTIRGIGIIPVYYPLNFDGSFNCSDRLFNKIHSVCIDTLRLCMHEHYEDCPWREQALYAMDSRSQMLIGYYTFGEYEFARASLELLGESQRSDGLLSLCAPCEYERTIPSFSLIWIVAICDYILYSGNLSFGAEMLGKIEKVIEHFLSYSDNGLIKISNKYEHWNFYEWADGMDNWDNIESVRYDAPLNAFFIMALNSYKQILKWIGNNKAEYISNLCEFFKQAFHRAFFNKEYGMYATYINEDCQSLHFSELTQALALLVDAVPKEHCDIVRKKLVSESAVETSISYLLFKYEALLQDNDKYKEYVFNDISEKWGYMLYNGATSFWETIHGDSDFENAGSLCHGWSAIPAYFFYKYILGIYPTSPGYETYNISPISEIIYKASGKVKTKNKIFDIEVINGNPNIKITDLSV